MNSDCSSNDQIKSVSGFLSYIKLENKVTFTINIQVVKWLFTNPTEYAVVQSTLPSDRKPF